MITDTDYALNLLLGGGAIGGILRAIYGWTNWNGLDAIVFCIFLLFVGMFGCGLLGWLTGRILDNKYGNPRKDPGPVKYQARFYR